MKNESKMSKFVAIVLLVTVVALILVSGTYAKYTSSADGTGTAYVATWAILLNDEDLKDATFDVFSTIYDSNGTSTETDVNSDETIIAPGTSGKFSLKLENKSDVTAQITLALTEAEGNADIPIEFSTSLDGTYYTNLADVFTGDDYKIAAGSSIEPTVYWRWAYEGSSSTNYTTLQTDATDTALGTSSYTALEGENGTRTSYNVTVSVTATQVD